MDLTLAAVDETAPGSAWAAVNEIPDDGGGNATAPAPLLLARFDASGWGYVKTGLDAFDETGPFSGGSQQALDGSLESAATDSSASVSTIATAQGLAADADGVWIKAAIGVGSSANGAEPVIARYSDAAGQIVDSWCETADNTFGRTSYGCAQTLDANDDATLPVASSTTGANDIAVGLSTLQDAIDVFSHGSWQSIATPGFEAGQTGVTAVFADPQDGWLASSTTLARISSSAPAATLASWPAANRNPLLSVALPPGQSTTDTAGALAVGLNGTALSYDPTNGWQITATPTNVHHIGLNSVAFDGSGSAFAVGQVGTILHWNGSTWSVDPQSLSLTSATLNAVAFAPDGEGWAVGGRGTILHYDGTAWSGETIDAQDANADVTSVAVAGQSVYAIADGNLIIRSTDGSWSRHTRCRPRRQRTR